MTIGRLVNAAATLAQEIASLRIAILELAGAVRIQGSRDRVQNPASPSSSLPSNGLHKLLDIQALAGMASVDAKTIRRQVTSGKLRATRVGSRLRFRREDVEEWLENRGTTFRRGRR